MQSVLVKFEVKKSAIEQALLLIRDFVEAVKENEPETILYHSFQAEDNHCEFVHVMTFLNEEAEERHRESEYCQIFADELYEICVDEPEFQLFNQVI